MLILKIIVSIVALRSAFMVFLMCKSYIVVSTRNAAALAAALFMIITDIFIICVSVRYIAEGWF